jgi:DNA-directed RNA polymerase
VRTNNNQHVDKRKSKNAIAPNIIHSMDSSHLLKTVLAAKAKGVTDFFLIHDAFGTTACDIEKMYHSIRESFVDLYDDYCLYQDFYNQVNRQLSDDGRNKLNVTIPPKGNLDLNTVLDSEYCFS